MTPVRHPVLARIAGAVLNLVGLVPITYGLTVLWDYFSHSERDAPIPLIVGCVAVIFFAPGILAILGALRLFRRSSS